MSVILGVILGHFIYDIIKHLATEVPFTKIVIVEPPLDQAIDIVKDNK